MFIANGAGVPIGIARAAIDALVELAAGKVTRVGSTLRDESYVQAAVARAESLLRGTRAYLYEVMSDVWETLAAGRELSPAHRAHFRLSMAASCQQSVEVVDLMYQVGGGSSLYAANPLDRYLRDVHTAQQHVVNSPKVLETAGQMLLGLEPGVFGF
jgi:indole-3-acetate monooxygenase